MCFHFCRYLPVKNDRVDFRSGTDPSQPNLMHNVGGKDIWLIHTYKLLKEDEEPAKQTPGTPSASTSSSSNGHSPPKPPVKRPSSPTRTPQASTSNGAKAASPSPAAPSAKRALFHSPGPSNASAPQAGPNKATHVIKDLNPYQNKYTIRARCTNKGDLVERSSSR